MGAAWDSTGVAFDPDTWREAYRVLKPGGHLIAFGGSRTYHRLACAIEDAGFEIRDQIMWLYGSGFPKSHDVSKGIDKAAGAERTVVTGQSGRHGGGVSFAEGAGGFNTESNHALYAPVTPEAQQWEGWGTALKPAHEPIVLARKPLVETVAANVLAHGTGALNIDGCRVNGESTVRNNNGGGHPENWRTGNNGAFVSGSPFGRFPANVMHDGSDEVLAGFPESHGQLAKASTSDTPRNGQNIYGDMTRGSNGSAPRGDSGSAARFFYCAKASKADREEGLAELPLPVAGMLSETSGQHITRRDEGYEQPKRANHHPTVKPTALMRYLCRLVTPPGGTVLDPFAGSGSTGKAALLEGFSFIGCEMTAEYLPIAEARLVHALEQWRLTASSSSVIR